MAKIPPELIDGVISQVHDLSSLKTCSLAGSVLRHSSQRILFRSFTLGNAYPKSTRNYAAACTLLAESPHIASYVLRLNISLNLSFLDLGNITKALTSFTNVHHCFVDGNGRSNYDIFPARLASTLLEFFTRQPLRHLEFRRLSAIPPLVFFGAAPSLEFYDVSIGNDMRSALPAIKIPLEQLVLEIASGDVYNLFAQPQCKPHTAALRRLSIDPQYGNCGALVSAAAQTLEQIYFSCAAHIPELLATIPLPPLPALRTVEFLFMFPSHPISCLLDIISQYILAANTSPALTEVVLTYRFVNWEHQLPPTPEADSLAALDAALVAHPGAPCIRCRLNFTLKDAETHCAAFKGVLSAGLPKTRKRGRLVLEDYRSETEYDDDNWRFEVEKRR
ncbi:hypothetical protein C8R43DRAFT_1242858 [Mycena crocata]|nr:hypothetical protein C8R43DRAFT_1242858 [Mycena crocata]